MVPGATHGGDLLRRWCCYVVIPHSHVVDLPLPIPFEEHTFTTVTDLGDSHSSMITIFHCDVCSGGLIAVDFRLLHIRCSSTFDLPVPLLISPPFVVTLLFAFP